LQWWGLFFPIFQFQFSNFRMYAGAASVTKDGRSMLRKFTALISFCLLLMTLGCESAKRSMPVQRALMMASPRELAQRFIAVKHKLEIVAPESEVPKAWESTINFCGTLQCVVVSSSITTKTRDSAASGSMVLRVIPEDLKKLFDHVQKLGNIVQHTTESEDKTAVVIDTDAKIKNLTSFRDSLRTMLARPSVTVKDFVEIQKQLTDVQSELDSETAQRKILANETEKVAVEITFAAERTSGRGGVFAPIWEALRESGSDMAVSVAWLISAIVTVIPWLVLLVPLCWLVARFWGKLRRKTTGSAT